MFRHDLVIVSPSMGGTLWKIAGRTVDLSERAMIMGVLNVTPDSFSDGGEFFGTGKAVEQGKRMASEGAQIIDVGGESTRPGAEAVSVDEELRRVIPVIEQLRATVSAFISIDTSKSAAARALGASPDSESTAGRWRLTQIVTRQNDRIKRNGRPARAHDCVHCLAPGKRRECFARPRRQRKCGGLARHRSIFGSSREMMQ